MDPLYGQSLVFALKLLKRGKCVRLFEYKNMPHAYWSMVFKGSEETYKKAVEYVKELLLLESLKEKELVNTDRILENTRELRLSVE